MQDIELIEGCAYNDKASQKTFYDRYANFLMGLCVRYASGEKDIIPMSLYVFKQLFNEMKAYPKDSDLQQWLTERIIWNAIQYLHKDKHKYFIAKTTLYVENKPAYEEITEEALSADACKETYLAALQALTPSYRILYNLTYIDEVPHDDIVKKLQIAPETYKAELEEARYQFKKQLKTRIYEQRLRRG
jgi:RNA polymerase sigma-70 factor (ECF subfamily)